MVDYFANYIPFSFIPFRSFSIRNRSIVCTTFGKTLLSITKGLIRYDDN